MQVISLLEDTKTFISKCHFELQSINFFVYFHVNFWTTAYSFKMFLTFLTGEVHNQSQLDQATSARLTALIFP